MFRILLSILISVAPILSHAQTTAKIIEANGALGIASQPNYVINSNAEKNTNDITPTNIDTFSRVDVGTSANSVIDGKWSFLINDDGNNGIIRFAANPMNSGKSGQNCAAFMRYSLDSLGDISNNWSIVVEDASNNEISPRVRLSDTYNSLLAPNPGISRTAIIPGYPCKAGQQNVFAVKHLAAVASQLIIDEIHVIDYPFPTSVPQGAQFLGGMEQVGASGCVYSETTSSGLTNFVALGTGTTCNAWTTKGAITATGTNDHRPVASYIPPGFLQIIVQGAFTNLAAGNCFWRISDGTNTYQPQAIFNQGTVSTHPLLIFNIEYSTSQSNKTFTIQAADDQASGCRFGDGSTTSLQSWKFYHFPTTGSNDSVFPASCINNPTCMNDGFNVKVNAAGTVSGESVEWITGNASISDTSLFTLTLGTPFTVAPICNVSITDEPLLFYTAFVQSTSTTQIIVRTSSDALGKVAKPFVLSCYRDPADRKSFGPMGWFTGVVTADSSTTLRKATAFISSGGVVTYLPGVTPWISSCGATNPRTCTFTGTPAHTPNCRGSVFGTSSAVGHTFQSISSTNFVLNTFVTNTAASSSVEFMVECDWSR